MRSGIVDEFKDDVLSGKLHKDPPVRGPYGEASINLKPGAKPKRMRGFQVHGPKAEALKKMVEDFTEIGWLEPSYSEWGSAAFVVPKKEEGQWRMVVDYRALNTETVHDAYSLPLIEPLLQKHSAAKVLSIIDMKKGYHQMPLAKESRACTAMVTPNGLWQWKVMPMGAKNGNAAFQRMMEWILEDFPFADPYVDDIIISTKADTYEDAVKQHAIDLHKVLTKLREMKLVADLSKAKLFVDYAEFCGHIIGQGTRRPGEKKLECLEKWKKPETVTELRSFLGFCNWYHDYIPMFASIASPMMAMLKVPRDVGKKGSKSKISWDPTSSAAFDEMKTKLKEKMELVTIRPDMPFVMAADASDFAVGAVLEQENEDGTRRPVGFWSRKLTKGQRRSWSPREKETYAIVEGLKRWSGYIGLMPIVIKTDHQALESCFTERVEVPSGPVGRRAR